jgi:hypothetical protein
VLPDRDLSLSSTFEQQMELNGCESRARPSSDPFSLLQPGNEARLKDLDVQAWLADVWARLPDHPSSGLPRPALGLTTRPPVKFAAQAGGLKPRIVRTASPVVFADMYEESTFPRKIYMYIKGPSHWRPEQPRWLYRCHGGAP